MNLLLDVSSRCIQVSAQLSAMSGPTDPVIPVSPMNSDLHNNAYRTTGTMYGATIKRYRPSYPHLESKANEDVTQASLTQSDISAPCDKNFKQFRKLNGGIMLMWCKHRICVGFHIIEKGEGRNDVFSPIYTRWTKAPELIVYDFACQLAPYSTVRQYEFFKDTKHLVDMCHESNHTTCSEAFKLSYHKRTGHQQYHLLNDSAGEVGNGGLDKLKTSVRYMSLGRFMDTCRLHLEVANRMRERAISRVVEKDSIRPC